MSGKTELFTFLAAAFGTIGGLLTLQCIAITHRDVVANEMIDQAPENPELLSLRNAEAAALETARMPLEDAKKALAERGRAAFEDLVPRASEDYSALSGWVHAKSFKPFVPPAPPPTVPVSALSAEIPPAGAATVTQPPVAAGAH